MRLTLRQRWNRAKSAIVNAYCSVTGHVISGQYNCCRVCCRFIHHPRRIDRVYSISLKEYAVLCAKAEAGDRKALAMIDDYDHGHITLRTKTSGPPAPRKSGK